MKKCKICNKNIILGENGCSMYDNCFNCTPINYGKNITIGKYEGDMEGKCIKNESNKQD